MRLLDLADTALAQPRGGVAIIAAKAPILVHHQPRHAIDFGRKLGGLLKIGRERLLAKHRQSPGGGEPHQRRVHFARRCDIDGVEFAFPEHRLGAGKGARDLELARAPRGIFAGGVGHRHDASAVWYAGPGDEMVTAHHAGADQADAQWLVHGYAVPDIA